MNKLEKKKKRQERYSDMARDIAEARSSSNKSSDTTKCILFGIAGIIGFIVELWQMGILLLLFAGIYFIRIIIKSAKDENYDKTFEEAAGDVIKDDFDWEYYESGKDLEDKKRKNKDGDYDDDEDSGYDDGAIS